MHHESQRSVAVPVVTAGLATFAVDVMQQRQGNDADREQNDQEADGAPLG